MKCIITTEYQTDCEIIEGRPGFLDKRIVIVSHVYLAGDGATYENFKFVYTTYQQKYNLKLFFLNILF